jgi:hypothetical protein
LVRQSPAAKIPFQTRRGRACAAGRAGGPDALGDLGSLAQRPKRAAENRDVRDQQHEQIGSLIQPTFL